MMQPRPVILEDVACPLGCKAGDKFQFTGKDILHNLPGKFTIVKCSGCGLLRTNPRPTTDTIGFYYPDDYGPYIGTRVSRSTTKERKFFAKVVRSFFGRILNSKEHSLPRLVPGRLLEVGCASGAFLQKMSDAGWHVQGIEPSSQAAGHAQKLGFHVHVGSLEESHRPTNPLDLIVGWMVLEHLHSPVDCLRKLGSWSAPGAHLIVSVPNAASHEFQAFKSRWHGLHLPNHLYHFTPDSITAVLAAAGWKVEKIVHQRTLTNLFISAGNLVMDKGFGKTGKWLTNFPRRPSALLHAMFPIAWLMSLFGQTGRMTVWATLDN